MVGHISPLRADLREVTGPLPGEPANQAGGTGAIDLGLCGLCG
jgi:hypothetical protein